MTVPVISLPLLKLSDDERDAAGLLRMKLQSVRPKNREKSDLYEAKRTALDLGISAPKHLPEMVNAVLGWPGTVVDVTEERLDLRGWVSDTDLGLSEIFRDNQLDMESGRAHLDALVYGPGFVAVGLGDQSLGEPEILVTVEATESCTVDWDYRLRRARSALSQTRDENGIVVLETLYLPNETILFERVRGEMVVRNRNPHGLGRVPVARMLNRDRASDVTGRSEITRAVVYYTDAAVRTALGMEINREFYTSPKWTVLNADPEVFGLSEDNTAEANRRAGWAATQGRLNVVPPQEDADGNPVKPEFHEFRPAPPTPYIDQIRAYSQLLAAESGIPAPYLGFVTDNPSSADAIRQQEYRLVKRAERRQTSFGVAWREVAYLSLLMRDGSVDTTAFRSVGVNWRDASTPTRAAAADEAQKLIAAGVFPSDSSVTYDRIGLSALEQQQLAQDKRRAAGGSLLDKIRQGASTQQVNDGNGDGTPQPDRPAE